MWRCPWWTHLPSQVSDQGEEGWLVGAESMALAQPAMYSSTVPKALMHGSLSRALLCWLCLQTTSCGRPLA